MAVIKTKTAQAYKKELGELQEIRDLRQQILDQIADKDSEPAKVIRGEIAELDDAINSIETDLAKKQQAEEKIRKKTTWRQEQPRVDQAMAENYMGYIIPEDRFIYCRDYGVGQNNVQFKMFNASRIVRVLNKMTGLTITGRDPAEIIDYFEQKGQSFYDVTSSFNVSKWNKTEIYNKMSVIRDHWLVPDFENADDYDPALDLLIYAVCGGKQENIEHLEKWVAYKYLNPNKNANIPNIDMGGNPGGNGKGRFVELLKTIFTSTCVVQAHREELEKFNANWEMAVILYYDEPEEKELAASKLKTATGAEDMRIEKKGIDATMADRNYNFIFLSNNEKGVVKLSGGSDGGEDRRYSVITTDIVLYDLLTEAGYDDAGAREWLDRLAQVLVKDRQQVSRWLAHIILKHQIQTARVLPALHGQDYHKRFDDQKDSITEAFDRLLPVVEENGCITQTWLHEAVKTLTENPQHKAKNVVTKFEHYLTRKRLPCEIRDRASIKVLWQGDEKERVQAKTLVLAGCENLAFEYSTLSNKKWVMGGLDLNVITDTTLNIAGKNQ
jgi:hypothetical protein